MKRKQVPAQTKEIKELEDRLDAFANHNLSKYMDFSPFDAERLYIGGWLIEPKVANRQERLDPSYITDPWMGAILKSAYMTHDNGHEPDPYTVAMSALSGFSGDFVHDKLELVEQLYSNLPTAIYYKSVIKRIKEDYKQRRALALLEKKNAEIRASLAGLLTKK